MRSAELKPQTDVELSLWQDVQRLIYQLLGLEKDVKDVKEDVAEVKDKMTEAVATAKEAEVLAKAASSKSADASSKLEALEKKIEKLERDVRGLKISRGKSKAKRDEVLATLAAMKAKEKKARASLRAKSLH